MLAQLLLLGLNNCIQCGSFGFRSSLLCQHCELNLKKNASLFFKIQVRGISCYGLYQWKRDRNRILNRLALQLKGEQQAQAWNQYADQFLEEWVMHERIPQAAIIVPCPALNDHKDHAYLFAQALSQLTGLPLEPLLKRKDMKEQKRLNRQERESLAGNKFYVADNVLEKISQPRPLTIYFVDDIITSGATVQAASHCLKKIGHVKAISLIIRE